MSLPAFAEMEAWWREPDPKQIEHFKTMARTLEAAGQKDAAKAMREVARKSEKPDPASTKPFVYPARAKQLIPLWVLPKQNAIELTLDTELTAFADSDETSGHYSLLTGNDTGPFTSDRSNMRRSQPWLTIEARRIARHGTGQRPSKTTRVSMHSISLNCRPIPGNRTDC